MNCTGGPPPLGAGQLPARVPCPPPLPPCCFLLAIWAAMDFLVLHHRHWPFWCQFTVLHSSCWQVHDDMLADGLDP